MKQKRKPKTPSNQTAGHPHESSTGSICLILSRNDHAEEDASHSSPVICTQPVPTYLSTMMILNLFLIIPCCSAFTGPAAPTRSSSQSFQLQLFVEGPPRETRPDYENIHGPLGKSVDNTLLTVFRSKMAEKFGMDSKLPHDDFQGLMELTAAMNARYSDKSEVQRMAQDVLRKFDDD
jgi:hypothetical protein